MIPNIYDSIRPLNDQEVPVVVEQLVKHPVMDMIFKHLSMSEAEIASVKQLALMSKTVKQFKENVASMFVNYIAKKTTFSLTISGRSRLGGDEAFTYISNHRDIILDSAFLNELIHQLGYRMPEVAIGDNLLLEPWIELLVKLCGCFIVKRNLGGRDVLLEAKKLSGYMHYNITTAEHSQWIAQREGRAKDSNDRTQISLLKMLAMEGEGDIVSRIKELNIVPLSISYEFDPCDYLKAREMQYKRDNASYKKTQEEDALNMQTGLLGYKGRVHFSLAEPLNHILDQVPTTLPKQQQFECIAQLIDKEIFKHYRLYANHYIALDLMQNQTRYKNYYSEEEKQFFIDYIIGQVAKIEMEEGYVKDIPYLYACMIKMYANPALNKLQVVGEL